MPCQLVAEHRMGLLLSEQGENCHFSFSLMLRSAHRLDKDALNFVLCLLLRLVLEGFIQALAALQITGSLCRTGLEVSQH